MKKIIYAFLVITLGLSVTIQAEPTKNNPGFTRLDKIVAIVNHDPITLSQLNTEIEKINKQAEQLHEPLPTAVEIKKIALDNLIAKSLQIQLCQVKGIKLPQEELNKTLENIAKANKITTAQLKTAVEQAGLNYDTYVRQISQQLLFQKLHQEEVAKNMSFTPEDVKKFVREHPTVLNKYSAFHIIDILLPATESSNQIAQLKKQANALASALQAKKDLDETLRQYPSAEKNDLGWRNLGEVPAIFQTKVAQMSVNSTSTPIQAPNGFHILRLVEAKGDNPRPTEDQIKNIAFQQKMSEAVKVWLEKIKSDAYIQYLK